MLLPLHCRYPKWPQVNFKNIFQDNGILAVKLSCI
uniref:Uncharacterized protein n=1 Tax=Anguilla anguilla TaxID=7936 RepID=A0A0E9RCK1_ANGAN